jgi:uncharacterized protein
MKKNNKQFKISCDLYQLDYKENQKLLYAPRLGYICLGNYDLVNLLCNQDKQGNIIYKDKEIEILNTLELKGVLNSNIEKNVFSQLPEKYKPLRLTLFPTNECNLACKYCYASAGDSQPQNLDFNKAKVAIDFVISNNIEAEHTILGLGFHGGGEPLLKWNLVKEIIEYAKTKCKENNISLNVESATNGVLSKNQIDYIVKNFTSLNISFDGDQVSQDFNRPLPNGGGSFSPVDKTFRLLDQHKFKYGIRSTVSSNNLHRFHECMEFMLQNYHPYIIHIEPAENAGRCNYQKGLTFNLKEFSEVYLKCEKIARSYNIPVLFSGCRFENLTNSFCGVSKDNFALTHEGKITSCFEITTSKDPRSETFFIGEITDNLDIIINEDKRRSLHALQVDKIDFCNDCFAKWHCAGDCVTRLGHNDYYGNRGHDRCELNRFLLKKRITDIFEQSNN